MGEIPPEELGARRQREDDEFVVVDIRSRDEFEDWHVPDSENVPVYETLKADREAAAPELERGVERALDERGAPAETEVVTVCAAGVLSQTATEILRERGYDARTLVDGMRGWSRVHRHAPVGADVGGTLVQVARPGKGCLSHVLVSEGEAAAFDPSQYAEEYEAVLDEYDATLVGVYDTHAHADHVSGGRRLADRHGVDYHLHPADAAAVDSGENSAAEEQEQSPTPLADGETFTVGAVDVEVIHTPGHSPGGVTFAVEDAALLTGDTLFHESVGRVELGVEAGIEDATAEDNAATLYESLERLRAREGDPLVLPAHDPGSPEPPVTARLSEVEARNDDLNRDRESFVAALAADLPEHPPNFQRVKRVNAGEESVDDDERASLELGPNRCAAE